MKLPGPDHPIDITLNRKRVQVLFQGHLIAETRGALAEQCSADLVPHTLCDSLADAVRVLEIERETWRQVCAKLAGNSSQATWHEARHGAPPPRGGDRDLSLSQPGSFSIEA